MKALWNRIDRLNWKARSKYTLALWLFGILFGLCGFICWLLLRSVALSTLDWMAVFAGYPVLLSPIVVLLFSADSAFHSGSRR